MKVFPLAVPLLEFGGELLFISEEHGAEILEGGHTAAGRPGTT